ncbi:MAG: alpha/beta hydrolase, partial [Candidatus Binataceae bacterium]
HSMSPAEARSAIDVMFAAFRGNPAPVGRVEDRKLPGGPAGDVPVRIYSPPGRGPFGGLVFFHGGGWVIGNIETHDALCRDLTSRANIVTISVDYRLAPEHKFPAAPEDCYAVTKWVGANTALLNIEPGKVAVGGDSAGGNLAAVIALMARDRGGPSIAFQALIYPVTDSSRDTASYHEFAKDGYILSKADMDWFFGYYLKPGDENNPWVAPAKANDLSRLPPALVLTAGYDPLRDEGEAYGEALRKAGVPVKISRYEGVCHGFVSMAAALDEGKRAVAEIASELQKAVGV